jgi:hypothetical protein
VNWAGFYLDDIEITGQPTDAAESTDGWTARGFTLVTKA